MDGLEQVCRKLWNRALYSFDSDISNVAKWSRIDDFLQRQHWISRLDYNTMNPPQLVQQMQY